jgi:hypothetical protein
MAKYKFVILTEEGKPDPNQEHTQLDADNDLYAVKKVLDCIGKERFINKQFKLDKEIVNITYKPVELPNLSEL